MSYATPVIRVLGFIVLGWCGVGPVHGQSFENENLTSNKLHASSEWYTQAQSSNPNIHTVLEFLTADTSSRHASLETEWTRKWIWKNWHYRNADGTLEHRAPENAVIRKTSNDKTAQPLQGGLWKSIGPYAWDTTARSATGSMGIGVARSLANHPNSPSTFIVGTVSAGIWRSTNHGASWQNVSTKVVSRDVSSITIAPSNPLIVYAASDAAVLISTDGGAEFANSTLVNSGDFPYRAGFRCIAVSPTDAGRVVVEFDRKIFRSEDGGKTWIESMRFSGEVFDVKWHPTSGSIVYVLAIENLWPVLWRSIDGGTTYSKVGNGLPWQQQGHKIARGLLATSKAAPEMVYTLWGGSNGEIGGNYGLYVSSNTGQDFTHRCCGETDRVDTAHAELNPNFFDYSKTGNGLGQITWDMGFDVSDTDTSLITAAGIFPYISTDGGRTWRDVSPMHYDIQNALFVGSEVWFAHDGGVGMSPDSGKSVIEKSFGINSMEIWGLGSARWSNVKALGAYHLPIFIQDDKLYSTMNYDGGWYAWSGADAMNADVNPDFDLWLYAKPWTSVRAKRFLDKQQPPTAWDLGIDLGYIPMSNLAFHPHRTHELVGADHATKSLKRSADNGASWSTIREFDSWVWKVKRNPLNSDELLVLADTKLWLSVDGGITLRDITPSSNIAFGNAISDAAFGSETSSIWITYGGHQSSMKVFNSANAGEEWTNWTKNLPSTAVRCIAVHVNSADGVFLGTEVGAYRYLSDSREWEAMDIDGLTAQVNFLRVQEAHGVLLAGTSRGLYQYPLPSNPRPTANISRDHDTILCHRQPVRFADASLALNTTQYSRSWHFPGGSPPTATGETAHVTYAVPGSYNATLMVSNEFGIDTFTLVNAVTVLPSQCAEIDGEAGNCLDLSTDGDFAILGTFAGNTNTFSVTAWVKPNGWQAPFSAIVCTDNLQGAEQEIGIQFANDKNQIGYLWKGGRWWWNSGLQLAPDKWSHVAMCISANGVELFVNGISAADTLQLAPQDLSKLLFTLGTYHYWSTRNFNGQIDEVSFFDRTLGQDEVRQNMHHVRSKTDNGLLAYYQFNETKPAVLYDRIRGADGSTASGASLVQSTAPVGKGLTQLLKTTTAGWMPYSTTSSTLFAQRTVMDTVSGAISWLKVSPDSLPTDRQAIPNVYWIYHAFSGGEAQRVERLRVNLTPFMLRSEAEGRIFNLRLRDGLDHLNSWTEKNSNANGFYNAVNHEVDFTITPFSDSIFQWYVTVSGTEITSFQDVYVKLAMYPMPATNQVVVTGIPTSCLKVNLYDLFGAMLIEVATEAQDKITLQVAHLATGAYRLSVGNHTLPLHIVR